MSYKNTYFQHFSRIVLTLFMMNTLSPTLHFVFADSTQYYVDVVSGSDTNDGLTPATAWQSLAQVNSTALLQGDTVSFVCGQSWTGGLTLNSRNGTALLPITINGYSGCTASNKPNIDTVNLSNSTNIVVSGLEITTPVVGNSVNIDSSSASITFMDNTLSNGSGVCMNLSNASAVSVNNNTFSGCEYAMNIAETDTVVNNNTFSGITQDAITISSTLPVNITQNTFTNIAQTAILYSQDTDVIQNTITNSCSTSSLECAAIKNNPTLSGATTSVVTQNTIIGVGSGIFGNRNYGIYTEGVSGVSLTNNNIINAEIALGITDAHTIAADNNTLLTSRMQTLRVIQNSSGSTYGNTFNTNTFLQKNPDYPYIEIRDEVDGSDMADSLISATNNFIYPLYKPNTSFVRTVNYGGFTREYSKAILGQFDAGITKFEYFAYKPYTFTGSFATANLLSNTNFDTDETLWTTSAAIGLSPTISYNAVGSFSGGSATVTPAGGSADRIWMTNDATLSVTSGQTYLVTGSVKSANGTINLRAFLHASANKNTLYSDRIAETFASATGNTFSFYLTTTATASDAHLSLETSNPDVSYEIDNVSLRRMNSVIKNNTANEVLIFSNTGSVGYNQACPGGVPCAAYSDTVNATVSWPLNVPAYSTIFTLWNTSTNILNVPTCSLNLSSGSVPTGQPVTASWNLINSSAQNINYSTFTGSFTEAIAASGSLTFTPPYGVVSDISINSINDVGPGLCNVQVTTTNTAPTVYAETTFGIEDAIGINGTLSGVDLNPGDYITFEQFGATTIHGALILEGSGSFQYFPNPDFCGNDTFDFRASDQLGNFADPVTQTISVTCANDTPVVVNDTGTGFATVPKIYAVIANDTDPDSPYETQIHSIHAYTLPTNGTVNIVGNQIEYIGNVGFSGTDSMQYSVIDQSGAISNTGTLTLTISIINNPPVVTNSGYTFNEDVTLNASVIGSDIDGNPLTFSTTSMPTHGTLTLMANGNFTYVPDANYFGVDSFDYRANDGSLFSNAGTITFNINAIPDAPIAVADSYSINQDTTFFIPVMNNDTDIDSATLSLTGYANPAHGTLMVSGTGFTYLPNTGYVGPDSFTYLLEDDTGLLSNSVTVSINVISTNNPPTANSVSFTVNEDEILSNLVTGTDPEMSTLTYTIDTTTTNGTLTLSNTGGFTYTPNPNYAGSDSFTFRVSDGVLTSTSATVNITVTPVNDIPVVSDMTFTATGNSMMSSGYVYIGTLSGSDIESLVSYTAATLPTHGVLTLTSTGYFTYTPAMGYTGSDSFSFTVSDGTASSNTGNVNIIIIDNGIIITTPVSTIDHYTIIGPSSVYVGQSFSIAVQAKDVSDVVISNYTGSFFIQSPTDFGATLPASGASISMTLSDGGIKSLTNSVVFTRTGTMILNVADVIQNASGSLTILVIPQPISGSGSGSGSDGSSGSGSGGGSPMIIASPVTGGGGGANGAGASQSFPIYNIVSVSHTGSLVNKKTDDVDTLSAAPDRLLPMTFVLYDPTGLLGQLFLMNRFITASGTSMTVSGEIHLGNNVDSDGAEVLRLMKDTEFDDVDGPVLLRELARMFLIAVDGKTGLDDTYAYALETVDNIPATTGSRMDFTKEYVLRIFAQHQRMYQETLERNVPTSDTMEPALN